MKIQQLPKEEAQRIIRKHQGKPNNRPYFYFVLLVLLVAGAWYGLTKTSFWINTHEIVPQQVLTLKAQLPFAVKNREDKVIVQQPQIPEYNGVVDTPIKDYACKKFGVADCKVMLAVVQAESGWKEDAYHFNTNNTLDVGLMMVNQVHWKRSGCSFKELTDPYKNIDCGYQIWKEQGWKPWVAHENGSFLSFLR